MGKQAMFKVQKNEVIAPGVHRLVLEGDTSACTAPGQFVNILMKDVYLRRHRTPRPHQWSLPTIRERRASNR